MPKLCLGGAFNPIHHGHLICARAVAEAAGLDTVVLVPNHVPPLNKLHPQAIPLELASPQDRLQMCRLAIADADGFEVDDRELRREGPSYTIDTAHQLLRDGWPQVHWLIGADQVQILPKWHEATELAKLVHFLVMGRPGSVIDWDTLPAQFRFLADRVIPAPAMDISSTLVRRRVAEGLPIDFLTPPAVCRYIEDHGLYRSSQTCDS
jgi:nicotinate-nucleotide adenylyltransferase